MKKNHQPTDTEQQFVLSFPINKYTLLMVVVLAALISPQPLSEWVGLIKDLLGR